MTHRAGTRAVAGRVPLDQQAMTVTLQRRMRHLQIHHGETLHQRTRSFALRHLRSTQHVTEQQQTVAVRRMLNAPQLQWRRATSEQGAGANAAQPTTLPMALQRPATVSSKPVTAASAPRAAIAREVNGELFSRANLDRLTDEVMGKLERRMRIERERRGL